MLRVNGPRKGRGQGSTAPQRRLRMRPERRAEAGGLRRGAPPAVGGRRRGGRGARRREAAENGGSRGSGGAGLVLERAFLAASQRDVGRSGRRAGRRAAVPAGEPRPLRLPAGARYLRCATVVREVSAGPELSQSPATLRRRPLPPPRRGAVRARWGLLATCGGAGRAARCWARLGSAPLRFGSVLLDPARFGVPFSFQVPRRPQASTRRSFHLFARGGSVVGARGLRVSRRGNPARPSRPFCTALLCFSGASGLPCAVLWALAAPCMLRGCSTVSGESFLYFPLPGSQPCVCLRVLGCSLPVMCSP